jgi:serine/threonine-protein kinase
MSPRTLGFYQVFELIGAGGMGEVYRARDTRLHRDVALKVLPASSVADPAARSRLLNEARAAGSLNHPNICTVYDVGEDAGCVFVAMELVLGKPLSSALRDGPLLAATILRLGVQVADALAHAHQHGVVHRDLKPANIMAIPGGRVKVLDFGLARLTAKEIGEATQSRITQCEAGAIAGTLGYLAPEVLRGHPADARSDIWALGITLYELATGRQPFRGDSGFEVSSAILRDAPSPLPAGFPPGLEMVIQRCLEKDPAQRYQSAAEVRAALEMVLPASAASLTPASEPPLPSAPKREALARRFLSWRAAAAIGALLLTTLALTFLPDWRGRSFPSGEADLTIRSLAVMPLDNMSGDASQDYFADGMTEALIMDIARIQSLRVISRTSVMPYKQVKKPLPQIARELNNVDAFLEGSVQLEGSRVRINVQLIHAKSDRHLWANSYDRELRDVLGLQMEIARTIAREIRARLSPHEERNLAGARAVHPEAHAEYLLGQHQLRKASREGSEKAIEHFSRAIAQDSGHALAYAGLAEAYDSLSTFYLAPEVALPQAKAAALRAVELDDTLAEAHASLGLVRLVYDWDWAAAEKAFRRALELNPISAKAHLGYGVYLATLGRFDEALQEESRARELDPLGVSARGYSLLPWYFSRRYEAAIQRCQEALQVEPQLGQALSLAAMSYLQLGRRAEALAAAERTLQLKQSPPLLAQAGVVFAEAGKKTEAYRLIDKMIEQSRQRYVCGYNIAGVYVALGEYNRAYQWLEEAFRQRSD